MSEEATEEVAIEYPQVYKNDDGAEIVALNDVQGAAFVKGGFNPAGKYVEKKGKKTAAEPPAE